MKVRNLLLSAAIVAAIPIGYYGFRVLSTTVHAANPPGMVPSTIVFSEIVSVGTKPAQHAIRVMAYKRDYSQSDTSFWTHNSAGHDEDAASDFPAEFDRHMLLIKANGFFNVEVYTRAHTKVTFPQVASVAQRKPLLFRNPDEDCLRNYLGTALSGNADKYLGKQQLVLPGVGLVETVMTRKEEPDITIASWYSPSLGCAEVQRVATFPTKDGSAAVDALYPMQATVGEPKADLFSDGAMPETDPIEAGRRNYRAISAIVGRSEAEIQATESKLVASAGMKNKEAHYVQDWSLFNANKARP